MLVELDDLVAHPIIHHSGQLSVDGPGNIGWNYGVVFKNEHGLIFGHFVHDFPQACVVDKYTDALIVAELTCLALQPLVLQLGLPLFGDKVKLTSIEEFGQERFAAK